MGIIEIFLIGVGLAMDAFAVSICKGLSMRKLDISKMIIIGAYFGIFQALMPLIGYLLGTSFEALVTQIDHWIAFILLAIIGGNMIKEALGKDEESNHTDSIDF
ncbi:MAG: manganese efflux pump, partial [Firmicutes bacterium]|nr:manganese efflux pump [Bacillota bacterium]